MPADWSPVERRQKDLGATWTKKHGKSHYGFKRSISVDRKRITDTAAVHDSQHFEGVLDEWNRSAEVSADRGYPGQEREDRLKAQGYRSHIQRKGSRNHPLSACQQRRNHRIAKIRARVEHIFAALEQMGGKRIRTIGQARADFALTMMAAVYNIRRLVFLQAGLSGPQCQP